MTDKLNSLHAVIMAAGKGRRIGAADKPKVLFEINGRPMLAYVLSLANDIGVANPVIVVGFLANKIKEAFGPNYTYVVQRQLNGTARAVMAAKPVLGKKTGITLILSGDHPFISASSLRRLVRAVESGSTISLLSGTMKSKHFDSMARVITNPSGHVIQIIELKDATNQERKIRRMNLGTYAVNNSWLWQALEKVAPSPVTHEYYLTEIIRICVEEGRQVSAIEILGEREAIGVNTLEHLKNAESAR